jgi:hypothetical protein
MDEWRKEAAQKAARTKGPTELKRAAAEAVHTKGPAERKRAAHMAAWSRKHGPGNADNPFAGGVRRLTSLAPRSVTGTANAVPDRWWAADTAERYWLEATDREDIGADLRAPELDGGGRPNWRYSLFKETRQGDVVLHYDKGRGAGGIVGFSRVAGPWRPAPIVWAARGTFARERGDVPEERPGYTVPLEGFTRLATPLTLARLRERTEDMRAMLGALERKHRGAALYFPFETAGPRELRLLQGYAFKLPAATLRLFPELDPVAPPGHALPVPTNPGLQADASGTRAPDAAAGEETEGAVRNPPWTRDELILALDLYIRRGGGRLSKTALRA